jgi:hypothetical protein
MCSDRMRSLFLDATNAAYDAGHACARYDGPVSVRVITKSIVANHVMLRELDELEARAERRTPTQGIT